LKVWFNTGQPVAKADIFKIMPKENQDETPLNEEPFGESQSIFSQVFEPSEMITALEPILINHVSTPDLSFPRFNNLNAYYPERSLKEALAKKLKLAILVMLGITLLAAAGNAYIIFGIKVYSTDDIYSEYVELVSILSLLAFLLPVASLILSSIIIILNKALESAKERQKGQLLLIATLLVGITVVVAYSFLGAYNAI
jgi:ABC-type multidrug transport system permease subunit